MVMPVGFFVDVDMAIRTNLSWLELLVTVLEYNRSIDPVDPILLTLLPTLLVSESMIVREEPHEPEIRRVYPSFPLLAPEAVSMVKT